MKKLLDETTDELTRSLLDAGRTHRPPLGNQARLLLALGVGTSVGLLSSKAFAWLGTSAGKLTLVSVGVLGIAGAAYTFAPDAPHSNAVRSNAAEASAAPASAAPASAAPASAGPASMVAAVEAPSETSQARAALRPQPSAATAALGTQPAALVLAPQPGAVPAPAGDASQSVGSSRDVTPFVARASRRAHAPAAGRREHRLSSAQRGSRARRDIAASAREAGSDGAFDGAEAASGSALSASTLKSEVALVDAMRGAAARRDGEALRRLIANYWGSFPEGQLRQEVSELALHPLATAR